MIRKLKSLALFVFVLVNFSCRYFICWHVFFFFFLFIKSNNITGSSNLANNSVVWVHDLEIIALKSSNI